MRVHELKSWPEFYEAVASDEKKFEYRKNDRLFNKGDIIHLREFNPVDNTYTGRELFVKVDYIWPSTNKEKVDAMNWGIQIYPPNDYVLMSISKVKISIS
jgi:hypothetical protein